jgi:hypothetical protein
MVIAQALGVPGMLRVVSRIDNIRGKRDRGTREEGMPIRSICISPLEDGVRRKAHLKVTRLDRKRCRAKLVRTLVRIETEVGLV